MKKFKLSILIVASFLSGCGSVFTPEPIAIGRDRDELKQSPCACFEIRQNYADWILPG